MGELSKLSYRQRCEAECTRSVIFLLQKRFKQKSHNWITDGVWLSREEAEHYAKSKPHHYRDGLWRVYGLPAEGELVELIKQT